MLPGEQVAEKVLFGCFEVNLTTGEVFRNGRKLRLAGQPTEVLAILLQRAGQLVTREELRALLWPGETFVDFDHGLNNCINRIRDALGDSAASPECIETLPKKGYRFIAPVRHAEQISANGEKVATANPAQFIPLLEPLPVSAAAVLCFWTRRRMWFAAISLLAIAVIAAIVVASHDRNSYRAAAIPNFQSVAVLPFANLSGDSSQEYLTDGITDELITQLARNTTVPIISRTSVMRYKNRQTPLPVVARELGIDAVIESSLQRTGSHFKISTHLIAATNNTPVWAASYEGDMKEVPQTVARIASEVGAILSRPASARSEHVPVPPVSADAYDEYLKGQFLWNAWQPLSALRHFQRVAALEPEFAAAYAGIAKSYCRLELTQVLPPSVAFPPASAAAEKALELDPHNSEGHAVRSYLYGQRDWDWNRAEQELKTAIAEDPGNSVGHRWYRYILHYKGRTEEALEQGRLALKADPASADLITAFAMELAHSKRYAEAIAAFSEAIEFAPEDDNIRFGLADAYEKTGKLNLAATELENGYTFGGEPDIADQIRKQLPTLGYQEAASAARRAQLLRQLDRLKKKSAQRKYVSPTAYTFVYAGLRDKENTLKWLDAAYAGDSHVMTQLRDETFDFVRQEPRFQKIWGNVPFSH